MILFKQMRKLLTHGDQSEEPKAILIADVPMMETQSKQPIKKFWEAYLQLKFLAKL